MTEMSMIIQKVKIDLDNALKDALAKHVQIPDDFTFLTEMPDNVDHGIFATNIAMVSAKLLKMAPRKIAELIMEKINLSDFMMSRYEIAGPGFINFYPDDSLYSKIVLDILDKKEKYGTSDYGKNEKVQVEFVSANPTGPMHLGNARGGALGDCMASVMQAAGYDVSREFYVNDAGNQIEKFGRSLDARFMQIIKGEDVVEFPEDGYHGEDIIDLAKEYINEHGESLAQMDEEHRKNELVKYALPKNISKMKSDIGKYRIKYDEWFYESTLHESGQVADTIQILKEKGLTYEKDGALWYKATELGSEKDEVLVRANGTPTYFAADIAYHRNKFLVRGFEKCIDIWGADHHGHVARMKGAMSALDIDPNKFDVVLYQLVKLVRGGEVVRMSKRTGKAIQLVDLLDEVPVDAARFYFNLHEANSQMDFDLDLAVKEDSQNPVYYVQYAHARICSIIKNLAAMGVKLKDASEDELKLLTAPEEIELIRHMSLLTEEIQVAARTYNPTRITKYVIELATLFHKFYNACRVKCDDEHLMNARLCLCESVRIVIKNILSMLKINAPDVM